MIRHVLGGLNVDDLPDLTVRDALPDRGVERSVPQHVADHDRSLVFLRGSDEFPHLVLVCGERFLEEHIVPSRQEGQGGRDVLVVHGAVDDGVGDLRLGRELLRGLEALVGRQVVQLRDLLASQLCKVRHSDDLEIFGALLRIRGVHKSAVSRANDNGRDGSGGHSIGSKSKLYM